MYSAELANRPIPRELDGGGAGAVDLYWVREKLLDPVFPARCAYGTNGEGLTGAISASKVTR